MTFICKLIGHKFIAKVSNQELINGKWFRVKEIKASKFCMRCGNAINSIFKNEHIK